MVCWKHIACISICGLFLAAGLYGFLVEPYAITIRHVSVEDPALRRVLGGYTLVHLSDLHISRIGTRERKALRMIEELQPDIILLTGDYVSWQGDYTPAFDFLSRLKATIGIWAVMGDYDYSATRKSCLFCHEQGSAAPSTRHGVRFLKNHAERVSLPGGELWIAGIDGELGTGSSPENVQLLTEHSGTLLLSHEPLVFEAVDDNSSVLILAGDTHGGQIPLPQWAWKKLGYRQHKYMRGLYCKARKKMYVTTGIGTSTLPVRFLRPPEIVVFHFV